MSVTITFVQSYGRQDAIEATVGHSLMECAIRHGVPGIVAECGGACACSTCHVYVEAPHSDCLPPMSEIEAASVEFAVDPRPESRLSCQVEVTPAMDGLVVKVPASQR